MSERDPQENARERQRERARSAESAAADEVADMLSEHKFPTTSEEIAADYGDEMIEMPNETESVGSVFDRLEGERYEDADEAREALFNELTGESGGREEYNDERAVGALDEEGQEGVPER